jgi:hypothetical protein
VSRRGQMVDSMLYPIRQMLPRATQIPQDWRLTRLLASTYDPELANAWTTVSVNFLGGLTQQ